MRFQTIAAITFGAGVRLGLTAEQAAPRRAHLRPMEGRDGWFETTGEVQFKRGEELLHEGDLPKNLALQLALPDGTLVAEVKAKQAARAAKPKAAAKTPAGS